MPLRQPLGLLTHRSLRRLIPVLIPVVLLCLAQAATAQAIRIGIVTDRSGPAADASLAAAVAAFDMRMESSGGVFGVPVEVLVADARSDPSRTRAELERLAVEEGVHAIVCCATPAAARMAREVAEQHDVLLLALAHIEQAGGGWTFGLAPDERTELRAIVSHAYGEGKRALALMTLENAFGDAAKRILEEELPVAGMELVETQRYAPDVTVLTPEALWVATRLPGAVVVWGLPQDTEVAVDALRRRGYEGPLYVRSGLVDTDAWDRIARRGVRMAVAPILVAAAAPDDAAGDAGRYSAARSLADMLNALYGLRDISAEAARAWDGLALLQGAAEQAALYGVPPEDVASYRLALRDAAIALPPVQGAGGSYDLDERSNQAALPGGLAIGEVRDGRLIPTAP